MYTVKDRFGREIITVEGTPSLATFQGVDLQDADFRNENLCMATFFDCNLKGADFSGANLAAAVFMGSDIGEAVIDDLTTLPTPTVYSPSYM